MELEILENTTDILKFKIKGVSVAFVNTLRRIILEEVPVLAIDECILIENTSVIFDEVLAHRLGLIPLKTDLDLLVPFDECTCEGTGCVSCTTMLTLEKSGSADEAMTVVYSGDLRPQNPDLAPVTAKIPLAQLTKDQTIILEAIAKVGRGKYHSKWQPVGTVAYKHIPHIEIDEEKCNGCEDCVKACVKNILEMKGDKAKIIDFDPCIMCDRCSEACDVSAIIVTPTPDEFIFRLEPTNALPADVIIAKAFEILQMKIADLSEKLKAV